ncbi:hypothetical protein C2S51_007581 [Perilla frutescens var. frutescens]|nr:hypothetical protein C2S51_007581 [Perilla frutescens var. frutescens]
MAALSYYSNWGPFQQLDYSDTTTISDPELRPLHDGADYFLDPNNDFFYSQNCSNYYDFANADIGSVPLHNINEPFFPHQEFEPPFHCPKRLKGCDSEEINIYSSFFNGFAPNPCFQDYSPPDILMPPPPMTVFPAADYGINGSSCDGLKREASGGSLSAQSVAARQRRRRITEKTQELGKLVPGGQKMNTAEMLQSAYKYIKFLQAQFALLEFVNASNSQPFEGEEELQILLESPLIQEKLYSTEHCLVPNKFVEDQQVRCEDETVKSNPPLQKDQ